MKTLSVVFIFLICLLSVLVICGVEYFVGDNMFLAVLVEGFFVFISIWFLLNFSEENYFVVVFLYSLFFILFETGVYAICEALGFVDFGFKSLISFRLLYNSLFTFLWIPLSCLGLKYKDKALWALFWICGFCIHCAGNLIMEVIS